MEAFLNLPGHVGAQMLLDARTAEMDDKIRAEWTALLPWMQTGHIKLIQWEDYRTERLGLNIDRRPTNVIIADLEKKLGRKLV